MLILMMNLLLVACHLTIFAYAAVFNFGDSNSDTGNLVSSGLDAVSQPYGQTYFFNPSQRYCDGRLIVDFLMSEMGAKFLDSYLDSIGKPDFESGCNFAAAASTILPATASSLSPFSLPVQVAQFLRFKDRVLRLGQKDHGYFENGLYMFDIGQNDLACAFYSKSYDQIIATIPSILSQFEVSMEKLHEEGARKFWIHNTGPLGCLPENIAKFGDKSKLDLNGCLVDHNEASKLFNLQLHVLCKKLQRQYTDSTFTYVDIYAIKSDLISNFSRYGFKEPLMACCGIGGPPLNYDTLIKCGETKIINEATVAASACDDTERFVNWDGVHYTDAANQFVTTQILTGKFSDVCSCWKNYV